MKWDYITAFCYYEKDCTLCLDDRKKRKSHWVLNTFDGHHYWLQDGLKAMGEKGWELVAVQLASDSYSTSEYVHPSHWYVFKKPLNS